MRRESYLARSAYSDACDDDRPGQVEGPLGQLILAFRYLKVRNVSGAEILSF